MRPVRQSIRNVTFSVREISERAARMDDVVRFDIGQPDLPTPPAVKEQIPERVRDDHITYTSLWGIPALRETIAGFVDRDIGAEHVMATTGGMGALYCILDALLDPGSEVLANDPSWAPYTMIAAATPGRMRRVPYFNRNGVNAEGVRDTITDDTKVMIINTPENPTGRVYAKEEVRELVDIAVEHDLYIIGDEVYNQILYDGEHVSPAEFAPNRTFTVNSLSKNFAMTGWRLGWLTFPDADMIEEVGKVNRATTACPNYLAQQAALVALNHATDYAEEMVEQYRDRRDRVLDEVDAMGWNCVAPDGAIYAFPDTSRDSWEVAETLLKEAKVSVVPGEPFGSNSDTNIRLCFGSVGVERMREGFERIRAVLT